jgi:hypothetical protein
VVVPIAFRLTTRLVTKRSHNRILNQINHELMERIRDRLWPKHFTNCPETEPGGAYGYTRRTRKYQDEKFKKYGQSLPLVLSGAFRATVGPSASVTATANSATLRSHSPHFMRLRNRLELEAISHDELKELAEWAKGRYVELANSPQYQETKIREPVSL